MAGNLIYQGPFDRQPRTKNLPVATALLPGTMVEATATQLVVLATAIAKRPLVLANLEFKDQDINTAYVAGDTGVAYELRPGDRFNARMAAATYTKNQPLSVVAGGRLGAAVAASIVVAFFDGPVGVVAADAFADVIIANSYTAA